MSITGYINYTPDHTPCPGAVGQHETDSMFYMCLMCVWGDGDFFFCYSVFVLVFCEFWFFFFHFGVFFERGREKEIEHEVGWVRSWGGSGRHWGRRKQVKIWCSKKEWKITKQHNKITTKIWRPAPKKWMTPKVVISLSGLHTRLLHTCAPTNSIYKFMKWNIWYLWNAFSHIQSLDVY